MAHPIFSHDVFHNQRLNPASRISSSAAKAVNWRQSLQKGSLGKLLGNKMIFFKIDSLYDMSHMFLLGPGLRQRFFFALPADFFPPQCRINSLGYLQHVKPKSCHFDNICNILEPFLRKLQHFGARNSYFCRNRKILELAAIWGWFS